MKVISRTIAVACPVSSNIRVMLCWKTTASLNWHITNITRVVWKVRFSTILQILFFQFKLYWWKWWKSFLMSSFPDWEKCAETLLSETIQIWTIVHDISSKLLFTRCILFFHRSQTIRYWTVARDEHAVPFLVVLLARKFQSHHVRRIQNISQRRCMRGISIRIGVPFQILQLRPRKEIQTCAVRRFPSRNNKRLQERYVFLIFYSCEFLFSR